MELMVILVLALVVLGPQRIPEVASTLGKAIRGFRKATKELRDQIDIEDEVRRPFEDLHAALRDEPARYRPPALVTASGDPNFPVFPLDPNFVPAGHGPVYDPLTGAVAGAPAVAVYDPNLAVTPPTEVAGTAAAGGAPVAGAAPAGGTSAAGAAPAGAAPVGAAVPVTASLVSPPDEPLVSANSGADHFQRAAAAHPPDKGAA